MKTQTTPENVASKSSARLLSKGRMLAVCLLALGGCLVYTWVTQDVLVQLSFMRKRNATRSAQDGRKSIVSIEPWQTANTLLSLAVSAEEQELARNALRLADHEVDQAFGAALRMASLRTSHASLTGEAQSAAEKVTELELLVKQDKLQVRQLGGDTTPSDASKKNQDTATDGNDNLELARAQLNLDSGELDDAHNTFARLLGDNSGQIQEELNAYHLAQQQAESDVHGTAARAVVSAGQHRTLMMRFASLRSQNDRRQLLEQAVAQVAAEGSTLAAERGVAQKKRVDALAAAPRGQSRLEQLKDRNNERQILAIYDARIEADQQLAAVYGKWIAQLAVQRRILMHLIVVSLAWILVTILVITGLGMLAEQLLSRLMLDNRQTHTLRTMTRLGLQIGCAAIVLLIVFGVPQHISTILGLTTAALTIALQDFVLAFLGWFLLMGHNGIHVGDWVEINGVSGEVVEVGLFNTTLLELNSIPGKGRPTGRRISLLNSYAIRGLYFNFSTSSQWMWDDVSIGIPKTFDVHKVAAEIEQLVHEKTAESARAAERDWMRVARGSSLTSMAASSTISMRPTVEGIEATVHYITRATERFATRDGLYLQLLALLQAKQTAQK
jgi:small-conductance mechanosensitive channel